MADSEASPDEIKLELERLKIKIDLVKHLSTLSTGSIVLIATFIDKLPKPIIHRQDLVTAIAFLGLSLIASAMYLAATGINRRSWNLSEPETMRELVFGLLAVGSFVLGVQSLGVFVIVNVIHLP